MYVKSKPATVLVRKRLAMHVDGPLKEWGGPKRMCMKILKLNLKLCNLIADFAQNRSKWRNKIHIDDPNIIRTRL